MKKIIFTLAAVGMLSACSLDETPYGFYSSDNFYKTEEDAESGLMYAYNALNYLEYLRGIWYLGDIPTETMYPKSDEPGDIHMLQQWTVNSETELTMYYFKYCYIGINRANTVIERVSGGNLNETVKNRVVGEALFLRAWNYFNLVRAYGRVPLYTEPISSLEETTPQMAESIDKIYDRILEGLLAAEKMLTVNKVFGRIDKVGAQALLSKVYLTLASSIACKAPGYASAPRNADEMYTQAAYWSRKVVFDYKETYNFDSDLRSIYDVTKPDGPEHIFIMGIDRSGTHEGMYSKIPLQFLPNNGSAPIYIRYSDGSLQKGNGNGWGVFLVEDNFGEDLPRHRQTAHGADQQGHLRPDRQTRHPLSRSRLLLGQIRRSRLHRRAHQRPSLPDPLFGHCTRLRRSGRSRRRTGAGQRNPPARRNPGAAGGHESRRIPQGRDSGARPRTGVRRQPPLRPAPHGVGHRYGSRSHQTLRRAGGLLPDPAARTRFEPER